jgi:periplasmic divalent cation tolerance protein
MSACLVCINAGSREEALAVGRALVEERLAAAANVMDGVTSIYHWQGAIEETGEALLIVKTRAALVGPLTERVRALHSYDCPAVVALPVIDGHAPYLAWIDAGSELLVKVFGQGGRHARSAIGVAELPRNAPVEIELIAALKRRPATDPQRQRRPGFPVVEKR